MIHLLCRCGIGDIISHLSRIDDIKKVHNSNKVKFWIGGFGNVPNLVKEIIDFNGYDCEIVKGWSSVHQNEMIKKFVENRIQQEDVLLDLNFELDIFNNKVPDFYKYNMQFPYDYFCLPLDDEFFEKGEVVGIQIQTRTGAPDFDHAGKRFWSTENWQKLIDLLLDKGLRVAIFGSKDDFVKIKESDRVKQYCGQLSVLQTMAAIKKCKRFIGTNSWMWEVAAFSGIPTICLYFTNTFFASLHIPFKYSEIYKNLYIETDSQVTPDKLVNYFELDNNVKISACVITQDESKLLDKCLDNLKGYVDEIVVIDGGSKDDSIEVAKKYTDKIFFRKFDNHMNQKNFAIENASHEWILIQDTDETYEFGFLNNMKRWITFNPSVDLFVFPRINIIEDLDQDLVKMYNFNVHPLFKWINYPDPQERLFKSYIKHDVHPVHHHVVGFKKGLMIPGFHSIHIKQKAKQIAQNERYKTIEKEWLNK